MSKVEAIVQKGRVRMVESTKSSGEETCRRLEILDLRGSLRELVRVARKLEGLLDVEKEFV